MVFTFELEKESKERNRETKLPKHRNCQGSFFAGCRLHKTELNGNTGKLAIDKKALVAFLTVTFICPVKKATGERWSLPGWTCTGVAHLLQVLTGP